MANQGQQQTIAEQIRAALGGFGSSLYEGGVAGGLNEGLQKLGQPTPAQGMGGPGAGIGELASRLGIGVLGGRRGVQSLFGAPEAPVPEALAPLQGPQVPLGFDQPQGPQVPQGPMFKPVTDIQMPEMPELKFGEAPNFEQARQALGPEVAAQKIGTTEKLSRTLGAGASGGLAAIQGARPGTAASFGEVLAGVGAGMGEATGDIKHEDRQLEELARSNASLRNKQLSSIALAEEAAKAELSAETARMWNIQEAQKVSMQYDVDKFNIMQKQPLVLGDGSVLDRATGEVLTNKSQTMAQTLQMYLLLGKAMEMGSTETAQILGQNFIATSLDQNLKLPTAAAVQAMHHPLIRQEIIASFRNQGKDELADRLEGLAAGNAPIDEAHGTQIVSEATNEVAYWILNDMTSGQAPVYPWYQEMLSQAMSVVMPDLGPFMGMMQNQQGFQRSR